MPEASNRNVVAPQPADCCDTGVEVEGTRSVEEKQREYVLAKLAYNLWFV
jgi:hypothetical protein